MPLPRLALLLLLGALLSPGASAQSFPSTFPACIYNASQPTTAASKRFNLVSSRSTAQPLVPQDAWITGSSQRSQNCYFELSKVCMILSYGELSGPTAPWGSYSGASALGVLLWCSLPWGSYSAALCPGGPTLLLSALGVLLCCSLPWGSYSAALCPGGPSLLLSALGQESSCIAAGFRPAASASRLRTTTVPQGRGTLCQAQVTSSTF